MITQIERKKIKAIQEYYQKNNNESLSSKEIIETKLTNGLTIFNAFDYYDKMSQYQIIEEFLQNNDFSDEEDIKELKNKILKDYFLSGKIFLSSVGYVEKRP